MKENSWCFAWSCFFLLKRKLLKSIIRLGLLTNNFRLILTKGFCLLTKNPPCPLLPLPPPVLSRLTISRWIDRIPTKIKWKMHALSTLYFKFWRKFLCLIKICKTQTPDLYLLGIVCITFYISKNYFWQTFRTSFNIIWKKDFCHKFYFFNGFTQTSHLRPKSAQRDKSFLSMLP